MPIRSFPLSVLTIPDPMASSPRRQTPVSVYLLTGKADPHAPVFPLTGKVHSHVAAFLGTKEVDPHVLFTLLIRKRDRPSCPFLP